MAGMSDEFPREFDARPVLPVLLGALPDKVVKSDSVVPIGKKGRVLVVAVLESCGDEVLEKVRFIWNGDLKVVVVAESAMAYAIQRYLATP